MPVIGYTGLFGSGKTAAAVLETAGRVKHDPDTRVLTNLSRLEWDFEARPTEYLWEGNGPDDAFRKIVEFEARDGHPAILLLDEVGVYLPARAWSRMPDEVMWKWNQLRKYNIDVYWTCVRPGNVVKDLRDITFRTHWCSSWRRFGFFFYTTYTYTAVGDKRYKEGQHLRRYSPSRLAKLYDTTGIVKAPEFLRKKVHAGDAAAASAAAESRR
jgi:hypothetical protein